MHQVVVSDQAQVSHRVLLDNDHFFQPWLRKKGSHPNFVLANMSPKKMLFSVIFTIYLTYEYRYINMYSMHTCFMWVWVRGSICYCASSCHSFDAFDQCDSHM